MLFNSYQFALFFIVFYLFYCFLKHRWQNRLLLLASYIFYAAWDWRFLSLILFSTVLDYFCGLKIDASQEKKKRRLFLIMSMVGNLGVLAFFKYYGFFVETLNSLIIGLTHQSAPLQTLNIILPLGISFYTFQTMSYTIDIYQNKCKPTKNFFGFALYVSFFPQLIAVLLSAPIIFCLKF